MLIAPSRTELGPLFEVKVSNLDLCIWEHEGGWGVNINPILMMRSVAGRLCNTNRSLRRGAWGQP